MYAVEKLGSYISRGVYTVSGPFHPFGGAVDIIVVQQRDGSFKSSPWYVRFGKFQGVLKTKEKIVNISVNGVEAGFSMYLDNKGEAFFLRESDGAEGDFVLTPPTSGDETDAESRHGRLHKVQSLSIESGKREELVTQADKPNAKIVARTSSRRSAILGFMFGRRSVKGNAKIGNMDRVTSLERAEIAADLLEMKWSTNLTSSDQKSDTLQEKPSENCESNASVQSHSVSNGFSHEEMDNSHGEGIGDNLGRDSLSNNHSEEVRDCDSPCQRVQEEVVQIYESEIGNLANSSRSISDCETSECILSSHNNDSQTYSSNFASICDDSRGEQLPDCRNHTSSEKYFEEISSGEEAVELFTLEVCHVVDRNETVSEMLTLESVEIDTQAKSLEEMADVSVCGGANEFEYFSYSGSTESSIITVDPGIKPARHVDLLSNRLGSESESGAPLGQENSNDCHCMNNLEISSSKRETIPELVPASKSGGQLGKENLISFAGMETVKSDCSVISDNSQYDSLMSGVSEDLTIDSSIQLRPSVISDKQFNITSYSPIEELVISETKSIKSNVMTKETLKEKERSAEVINYFGNQFQIEETLNLASFKTSPSIKQVNSVDAVDSAIIPTAFGSFNSSCEVLELQNHVEAATTVISSSLNTSGQEFVAISPSRELEEPDDPLKCLEDIQFLCSDTESCGAKENDSDVSNSESLAELDDGCGLITETQIKENGVKDLDNQQPMECTSEVSRFHSDPINIPGCRTVSDGDQLSSMSLPIICSYTSDLEGSTFFHPLSCSLDVKSDIYELDVLEKEHSSSVEPQLVSENNKKRVEVVPEAAGTPLAAKILGEQNSSPINDDVELPVHKKLVFEGMGTEAADQAFDAEKEQIFEAGGMISVEGNSRATTQPGGSWRLWPFSMKRSRTIGTVQISSGSATKTEANLVSMPKENSERRDMPGTNGVKKFQSLTPTSEELASLDLKEGANVITFKFSTPMLGMQQVDARIYLWRWNSHIVISDVDGTITKSDVLGQFMPLVGIDWSQTGVAHLFSAIKENGYQLLFLSARAISQAHLTRQFLFNLKQDGKALPDGPVVISPDGLFPSLYREVIRRAPHEFKISCLEAIKELFPPDRNPFYAGFGNRDTDEISYLKVGIPLGKIFIINPKGQVAVNRRVDTKSYTSLHELVNAMFPPATSDEQEDYNSWNFWKLPHTKIDI